MRKFNIAASFALCCLTVAMPAHSLRVAARVDTPVVTDVVSPIDGSSWQYSFSITNMGWWSPLNPELSDSVRLIDFQLPYFSDAGITSISAPTGWAWSIDPLNTFNLGNGTQTLRWFATSVAYGIAGSSSEFFDGTAGDTLAGFSFIGAFAPVKAPFIADFPEPAFQQQGDPALPGSPDTLAAGLTNALPVTGVPEPETYAMMLVGLGLLGFAVRRSKQEAA